MLKDILLTPREVSERMQWSDIYRLNFTATPLIPSAAGIYMILGNRQLDDVLYVGKSDDLRSRLGDHMNSQDRRINRQYIFHAGFGKPFYHTTPSARWTDFLERHGLKKVRLHDLRHTTATLLIEEGASLKAVQKRLRHTQYSTTAEIYSHVTKKLSRDTAEKFDKFNPKASKNNSVNNPSTIG